MPSGLELTTEIAGLLEGAQCWCTVNELRALYGCKIRGEVPHPRTIIRHLGKLEAVCAVQREVARTSTQLVQYRYRWLGWPPAIY